jgi:hypothetical protein
MRLGIGQRFVPRNEAADARQGPSLDLN